MRASAFRSLNTEDPNSRCANLRLANLNVSTSNFQSTNGNSLIFHPMKQAVAVSHPDVGQADDADQIDSSSDSSSDGSESQSSDDEPASKKICTTGINDIGPVDEALVAFSSNITNTV